MAYGFNNDKSRADMPTLEEFNQLKATVNALVNAIFPLVSRVGTIGEQRTTDLVYENRLSVPTYDPNSNSNTDIVSISLPKGVWFVQGFARFKTSGVIDRGVYCGKLSKNSKEINTVIGQLGQTVVDDEINTHVTVTTVFVLDETTTIYLVGFQNSGITVDAWGSIVATRLAPDVAGDGDTAPLDYNLLSNKPLIENVTLLGNKTFEDLGLSGGENISFNNATISSPQMTSAEAASILTDN